MIVDLAVVNVEFKILDRLQINYLSKNFKAASLDWICNGLEVQIGTKLKLILKYGIKKQKVQNWVLGLKNFNIG